MESTPMALTSPATWQRFSQVNVGLDALQGSPGVRSKPSGAFGRSAKVRTLQPATRGEALVLTGEGGFSGSAAAAARTLFAELGVAPKQATRRSSVRPVTAFGSRAGQTVVLQQHIDGHDIVGANVKIQFAPSGSFTVSGRPIGDLADRRPKEEVSTTAEQARLAAATAFDLDPSTARETSLKVFPLAEGGARWVWRVSLFVESPVADVRAYLDAVHLDVLLSYNVASAFRGTASVYPIDPLRTPDLRRVSLADLGPIPADQLSGGRLIVVPSTPPGLSRPDRDFRLTDTDVGFDEANAYYHLRSALRYFGSLRGRRPFPSPPFRPIKATVRDQQSPDNAFYLPDTGELRFGDVGSRPTARSADILCHELGHAVSNTAGRLSMGLPDSQTRGLSEGYSDYFAASKLGDPHFGDWVSPDDARDASNPNLRFPLGFQGSEHETGAVWAGVLWAIRSQAGARDTDRITFESINMLSENSSFADGLTALLRADADLSAIGQTSASHAGVIAAEWARRAP
jgi:hypothetical protein